MLNALKEKDDLERRRIHWGKRVIGEFRLELAFL